MSDPPTATGQHLTATYRDYWSGDHRPYRNMIVDSQTGEQVAQLPILEHLFIAAGVQDGDEITITVAKTGRKPFGDRRVILSERHTYTLETEVSA